MFVTARLAFAGLAALMTIGAAQAGDALKARIGVLRLSSSAPVFIAQDKGYFRDAGLDVELKFFDAAQPIAVATTSGPESDRRHEPRESRLSPDRVFRQQ